MARHKDEALHQERRLQILHAAAGVFRVKGFHAARTEEICAAAGLSAGTVFRYFRDKEEIIAIIAEMEFDACQEVSKALFSREGLISLAGIDGKELEAMWQPTGLGLGLDSWLELCRSKKFATACKAKDDTVRAQLAESLYNGQAEGWVRPGLDPKGAARVVMALFSGITMESQLHPTIDFEQMAAGLRDLLRVYILTPSCSFVHPEDLRLGIAELGATSFSD